jgi:ABC-type sugar transport system ATPase subunit
MAPPLIQLKDIKLTFGGTPLLSGVELSVSSGRARLPDRPQRLRQIDAA